VSAGHRHPAVEERCRIHCLSLGDSPKSAGKTFRSTHPRPTTAGKPPIMRPCPMPGANVPFERPRHSLERRWNGTGASLPACTFQRGRISRSRVVERRLNLSPSKTIDCALPRRRSRSHKPYPISFPLRYQSMSARTIPRPFASTGSASRCTKFAGRG